MTLIALTILVLTTARIHYLLAYDRGPYEILDRFRAFVYDTSDEFYILITCAYCNSIWVAIALIAFYVITPYWSLVVMSPFAISMGAIIVVKFSGEDDGES